MPRREWFIALLVGALLTPTVASATQYKVDDEHTSVTFRIRHLFTYVEGRFDKFAGEIVFDLDQADKTNVKGTIEVASINTNVAERDKHLKSKDFFNVEEYPHIKFESTKVTDVDKAAKSAKMHGKLTIHGVEKAVVLDVQFLGKGADPYGNQKAGFSARTKVNRKDFGLNWNETLETGGLLVGEDVEIRLEVEGNAVE